MKRARHTSKQGLLIASWPPMWTNGICGYVSLSLYDPAIGRAANMVKGLYRSEKWSVLGGILPVSIVSLLWSRWLTPSALYYLTCRYGAVFPHPCSVLRNWQLVNNTHCYIEQAWTRQKLEVDENVALPYEVMTRWVREIWELALEITYTQSRLSLLHRRRVS